MPQPPPPDPILLDAPPETLEALTILLEHAHWVGSMDKEVPLSPHTGRNASSVDADTWRTYEEVQVAKTRLTDAKKCLIPTDFAVPVHGCNC